METFGGWRRGLEPRLFLYYLSVRFRQFLGRALRLGRARGPSAAARKSYRGPGAAA